MSDDPSLPELRCPTCGGHFTRLSYPEDEGGVFAVIRPGPVEIIAPGRPYLICEHGHQWSIKTITKRLNHYDRILLGDYLGAE